MSSAGEAKSAAVKNPQPVKEKKPKAAAAAEKKPKSVSHPPYFEMIKEALVALNEKGGSSPHAIAKFMEEKHKSVLPANFRKILSLQLKNSTAKGKLVKVKASFKLSEAGKKDSHRPNPKPVVKKPAAIATATKKPVVSKKPKAAKAPASAAVGAKRKVVPKKTEGLKKKAVSAKPKVPMAKSIKSPAAKSEKKAVSAKPKVPKAKSIKSPAAKSEKKAVSAKPKVPRAKSIKSPAAKRAKKASA